MPLIVGGTFCRLPVSEAVLVVSPGARLPPASPVSARGSQAGPPAGEGDAQVGRHLLPGRLEVDRLDGAEKLFVGHRALDRRAVDEDYAATLCPVGQGHDKAQFFHPGPAGLVATETKVVF